MKLRKWEGHGNQNCTVRKHTWAVSRLIELSKSLPVREMPIDALFMDMVLTDEWRLKDMATHFIAVRDADLNFPIILDEDGVLMDGRHRIVKALVEGVDTIKFVRFETNPEPDSKESE